VIRVSNRTNDEVAVVPVVLIGHPVGPTIGGVDPNVALVAVGVSARPNPHGMLGWVRANLGGRVNYDVTVTVRNLTTETLTQVALFGSVARGGGAETDLGLDNPGAIGPGQTWQQVVSTDVPAPSFSQTRWQVVASRAGPLVTASSTTRHRPVLLLLLAVCLIVDVAFLIIRSRIRRRLAREKSAAIEESAEWSVIDVGERSVASIGELTKSAG
jgi:hypothetical protein